MSRYFDALNRVRRGREATSRPDLRVAERAEPVVGTVPEEPAAGPGLPFPELQLASRQASYATLLDLLRATSTGASIPAVIVAGVAGGEPVREVVKGIEVQALRQGVAFRSGRLGVSTGTRMLYLSSQRPLQEPGSSAAADHGEELRLPRSREGAGFGDWLGKAAAGSDLLLIEGPPLNASVEAALVGGACAGLVLVAEALVTKRSVLQSGLERARLADCEILGIVLTGTRRWLPNWLVQLTDLLRRS